MTKYISLTNQNYSDFSGQCNMKFLQPRKFQLHLRNNTACRQFLQNVELFYLTSPKQVTSQGDAPTGMISLLPNFNIFILDRALSLNFDSLTLSGHFKIKLSPFVNTKLHRFVLYFHIYQLVYHQEYWTFGFLVILMLDSLTEYIQMKYMYDHYFF